MSRGKPYRVDAQAWRDVEEASDWYRERSPDASAAFLLEVIEAFEIISEAPQRWPEYLHETRRYVLQHFPFSVVYLDDPDEVLIVAVAHSKRRPEYWIRRG